MLVECGAARHQSTIGRIHWSFLGKMQYAMAQNKAVTKGNIRSLRLRCAKQPSLFQRNRNELQSISCLYLCITVCILVAHDLHKVRRQLKLLLGLYATIVQDVVVDRRVIFVRLGNIFRSAHLNR